MKVIKSAPSMDACGKLGIPLNTVQGTGIVLLVCTVIYIFPRTTILGALLLTGYLGGATAIMVRAEAPFYFPIVFGILVWLGVYLRDQKLSAFIKG